MYNNNLINCCFTMMLNWNSCKNQKSEDEPKISKHVGNCCKVKYMSELSKFVHVLSSCRYGKCTTLTVKNPATT